VNIEYAAQGKQWKCATLKLKAKHVFLLKIFREQEVGLICLVGMTEQKPQTACHIFKAVNNFFTLYNFPQMWLACLEANEALMFLFSLALILSFLPVFHLLCWSSKITSPFWLDPKMIILCLYFQTVPFLSSFLYNFWNRPCQSITFFHSLINTIIKGLAWCFSQTFFFHIV